MVPIHESDLAENRWKTQEWSSIELWESVEARAHRRRKWIIVGTMIVFLLLSAIPIVKDRLPKWRSLAVARHLAERLDRLKLEAVSRRQAVHFRIEEGENDLLLIKKFASNCEKSAIHSGGEETEPLRSLNQGSRLTFLRADSAAKLGLERISTEFCFDPQASLSFAEGEGPEQAVAILPVKDLTEPRTDRISFVFFRQDSAQLAFD